MADDEEIHLSRRQARGGASTHVVRYVLSISLILVVVLFGILLFIYR
jgi:hypothetical protein